MKALGIMGGTFDPIHYGHLVTAEAARYAFGLERVIFVPAAHPPHKEGRRISLTNDRYLMTVLATMTNPAFEVSQVEIERGGPSYTIETMRHFRSRHPEADLHFITGGDAILEICTWEQSPDLFKMCQFIAATRPGYPLGALEGLRETLGDAAFRRIHRLEVPALAISSSEIRRRVAAGQPVKYLLPESVENYITKHNLYREEKEEFAI